MTNLSDYLGFVHKDSQRTGYVTDGPWGTYDHDAPKVNGRKQYVEGSVFYMVIWDDTGESGEAFENAIEWIPKHKRHITDGVRKCHCGPTEIDGIVLHRSPEELN
jgi:hypothetical protein